MTGLFSQNMGTVSAQVKRCASCDVEYRPSKADEKETKCAKCRHYGDEPLLPKITKRQPR